MPRPRSTATAVKPNSTATEAAEFPYLVHVDPGEVLTDLNIREVELDKPFVDSIKADGVLQPVVAVLTGEGKLRIRLGNRRTHAAIKAKVKLPVYVVGNEATSNAATIDRLVKQFNENERRQGLSVGEQIGVVGQLAVLGVSATQIGKRLGLSGEDVDAARRVASSPLTARAAQRDRGLSLPQLAVVAEFEGYGEEDVVKALLVEAKSGGRQFDHIAQRARDERERRAARDAAAAEYEAAGLRIVHRDEDGIRSLYHLRDAKGKAISDESHASCPGHAAYLEERGTWVTVEVAAPAKEDASDAVEASDAVDEVEAAVDSVDSVDAVDAVDEGFEGFEEDGSYDEEEDYDDGVVQGRVWKVAWQPSYVCTDWQANGHTERTWGSSSGATVKTKMADLPPAEQEKRRAERKDVIDSNKAWGSAEKVRRAWLKTFVARKTAPKGTGQFLGVALAADSHLLTTGTGGNDLTADMLGMKKAGYGRSADIIAAAADANDGRGQVLALAVMLGAYEAATDRNAWRSVRQHTARYLRFLESQGYPLAPVERRACGEQPQAEAQGDPLIDVLTDVA